VALVAAVVVAAVAVWSALAIVRELRAGREDARAERSLRLLALLAPGVSEASENPRALLVWQPLAATARALFPGEFAALDRAAGASFPVSSAQIEAAHARWTAEWLAWERAHDTEFKLKAAAAERELLERGDAPLEHARLDAIERQKLDLYQRRYEEYIRVAKALQALTEATPTSRRS
jgi:hypothetical protein